MFDFRTESVSPHSHSIGPIRATVLWRSRTVNRTRRFRHARSRDNRTEIAQTHNVPKYRKPLYMTLAFSAFTSAILSFAKLSSTSGGSVLNSRSHWSLSSHRTCAPQRTNHSAHARCAPASLIRSKSGLHKRPMVSVDPGVKLLRRNLLFTWRTGRLKWSVQNLRRTHLTQ